MPVLDKHIGWHLSQDVLLEQGMPVVVSLGDVLVVVFEHVSSNYAGGQPHVTEIDELHRARSMIVSRVRAEHGPLGIERRGRRILRIARARRRAISQRALRWQRLLGSVRRRSSSRRQSSASCNRSTRFPCFEELPRTSLHASSHPVFYVIDGMRGREAKVVTQ